MRVEGVWLPDSERVEEVVYCELKPGMGQDEGGLQGKDRDGLVPPGQKNPMGQEVQEEERK